MQPATGSFTRVALVLPTEFAYARGVLRGIIAATRARNLYAPDQPRRAADRRSPDRRPAWQFRVYRGIYGHSSKYLAKWFDDWKPDGIICQIYDDRLAKVYERTRAPVIELFESRAASQFPRVLPDDVAAGRMAARHFVERGFRHFAFFGAPWMIWSREREAGFRREIEAIFAARAADPRISDASFTFASIDADAGKRALRGSLRRLSATFGSWLKSLPRPTALFVANDLWGFELVQAAREAGLQIPGQIAILGVDNEELLCEMAHPPLSSIRIGAEQIGHVAVENLEKLLAGGKPEQISRVPPVDVVTRQSTDILAVEDPDVAAALTHIRQHAADGLSVKQVLEAVTVNRRTLERRFVSLLGHTPLEEIHRVRLEHVKACLQTDMPIYQVAARCGYGTPEHLATSFLKATGQTPSEFRRSKLPAARWQGLSVSS